jgi:mono/diheme cytochrome c family protein
MRAGGGGKRWLRRLLSGLGLGVWALLSAGCSEQDMVTQPKLKPLQPSAFFADGASARPVEPGTVARGQLKLHPEFDAGDVGGKLVAFVPLKGFDPGEKLDAGAAREARLVALERGRERFNIYCSPCHDRTGAGNGIIVQRGFTKPPSFLEERLRKAPPGHFFKVMTNGYGAMYSYASRISPADRWAIVTYIRALQQSQNAQPVSVATGDQSHTQEGPAR